MKRTTVACALALLLVAAPSLGSQIVYDTGAPTGFFVPFDSSTPDGTKFGDSGWFGGGGDPPVGVVSMTLGLAVYSDGAAAPEGTTDLLFTFNDGDPSGMIFGPGTTLYSTTLEDVVLPATDGTQPTYFEVQVPIPGAQTAGGFNNFGFSLGVENFSYGGEFGFQNRGDFNNLGFYTNNASEFTPGSGWSLFSFGPSDPADIANFVMRVEVPEPTSLALLAFGMLTVAVRRR